MMTAFTLEMQSGAGRGGGFGGKKRRTERFGIQEKGVVGGSC